jgi:tetratricopeptide (TPR) repeat protein
MEKDISEQEFAQKALEELEKAGKFEEDQSFRKAIEHYEKSLEYLERSGYMEHRIGDIRQRVNQLKEKLNEIKIDKTTQDRTLREDLQTKAFETLDKARIFERGGAYERAIEAYEKVIPILEKAGWSIDQINKIKEKRDNLTKNVKEESSVKEQREMQYSLQIPSKYRKKEEKKIEKEPSSLEKDEIGMELGSIPPKIKQKEEKLSQLREEKRREAKKQDKAFILLDKANNFEKKGNYKEALKTYQEAIEIFKEINWDNYISPIIEKIDFLKRKQETEQETIQKQKEREKSIFDIKESIREKDLPEEAIKEPSISEVDKSKAQEAEKKKDIEEKLYALLEKANFLYDKGEFDESINLYQESKGLIKQLGKDWVHYLSRVDTSIWDIERKKQESLVKEKERKRKEQEKLERERQLKEQISSYISKEKEKTKQQEMEKLRKEKDLEYREQRKEEAFHHLDTAKKYIKEGYFDKAIQSYQEAGNIFAEIQWIDELPIIRESIKELEQKKKEKLEIEKELMRSEIESEKKDSDFHKKFITQLDNEIDKLKEAGISQKYIESQLKDGEEEISYKEITAEREALIRKKFEEKRQEAFKLLDQAENLMKNENYDNAIEIYEKAKERLGEINFPIDSIEETIELVELKKEEKEIREQQKLEFQSKKLEEQREFQEIMAKNFERERSRLKERQLKIEEYEKSKELIDQTQNRAFKILEEAEDHVKSENYSQAIEKYREAQFLLNQIHYPTQSIAEIIARTISLKNEKEKEEEKMLEAELSELKKEKKYDQLETERKREERRKKIARHYALQERERLIEEQQNIREAAYELLDEGSQYLKQPVPDYTQAISLYIQAKDLLQKKIGWVPEIKNLQNLINNLRQEKLEYLRKKKAIIEEEKRREKEYQEFQEELKLRRQRVEEERRKKEQKLRELETKRQLMEKRREEAFNLIGEGKNLRSIHKFQEAYEKFRSAKTILEDIGWKDQTKFITQEIQATKDLEVQIQREQIETKKYQEELARRQAKEQELLEKREEELKKTVEDVDTLTDEVSTLIEQKRKEFESNERLKQEKIKKEAKEFAKSLREMMKIKQELNQEIKKSQDKEKRKFEEQKKETKRKDVDDILKMLKDVSKKE